MWSSWTILPIREGQKVISYPTMQNNCIIIIMDGFDRFTKIALSIHHTCTWESGHVICFGIVSLSNAWLITSFMSVFSYMANSLLDCTRTPMPLFSVLCLLDPFSWKTREASRPPTLGSSEEALCFQRCKKRFFQASGPQFSSSRLE